SLLCPWFISFAAHYAIKGAAPNRDRSSVAVRRSPDGLIAWQTGSAELIAEEGLKTGHLRVHQPAKVPY
ncbi:MAG: hypothetical protein O2873_11245, partial [Proteobacteria bacterium]|nr:hypothetical protein [Pseudomonadota bacterium]